MRNPEHETWWIEMEHPIYGTAKVSSRWQRVGRGLYAAVVTAVEFDLFTPQAEQEALMAMIRTTNIRAVAPMENTPARGDL